MLLDTNAYSALARGVPIVVDVVRDAEELSLPLPVIAELRYGFAKGPQPDLNERVLQKFLAQPQISIAVPTLYTTKLYAELQLLCQRRGRVLAQNNIWIAALAREADDLLVTFNKDFTVFADVFGEKLLILE
jgi:tRNA(fMet)-specific endonuclease VapC